LAAILNAILLHAAIIRVRRINVSYFNVVCSVRYSSYTEACMELQSLWEIAFFPLPEFERWSFNIGGTVGLP